MMTKNDHQSGFWPSGFFCSVFVENNGQSPLLVMIDGGDRELMGKSLQVPT